MSAIGEIMESLGALAEMSLMLYRATRGAGATREEAKAIMDSFMHETLYGPKNLNKEDPEK